MSKEGLFDIVLYCRVRAKLLCSKAGRVPSRLHPRSAIPVLHLDVSDALGAKAF